MSASYPGAVKSFTNKSAGDTVQPAHVDDLQDEVTAIETDLLKAWTTFTPTWTNVTVGNASVNSGKYLKLGKIVFFRIDLVLGSTSAVTGAISVAFPVTAQVGSSFAVARGEAIDASTGDAFELHGRLSSSSVFALLSDNGTKLVNTTGSVPFTWAISDELHLTGWYEIP
jgi:hypothetical protein